MMEIRCCHPSRIHRSTSTIRLIMSKYKRNNKLNLGGQNITIRMQFLNTPLSPTVIFMALGYPIQDMISMIKDVAGPHWYGEAFEPFISKMKARHPPEVVDKEKAQTYIMKSSKDNVSPERKLTQAQAFLQNDLFPQIGLSTAYHLDKAYYLAFIIWKLLMKAVGFSFYDSKDYYANQRYDTNGTLWASLERQLINKIFALTDKSLRNSLKNQIPLNFKTIFLENKLSDMVASCLAKGTWQISKQASSSRTAVSLNLKTTNYWTYASSIRRANTPNKAHRRSMNAKQIDEAQYGRLCAVETPEGEMCGIARFLAMGASVSTPSSNKVLLYLLRKCIPQSKWSWLSLVHDQIRPAKNVGTGLVGTGLVGSGLVGSMEYFVDLDGRFIWKTSDPKYIVQTIRSWRRKGLISPYVNCEIEDRFVKIRTTSGRNVRLLIVLSEWCKYFSNKPKVVYSFISGESKALETAADKTCMKLSLQEALHLGILEYIDAMEERSLSIAFSFDDLIERSELGSQLNQGAFNAMGVGKRINISESIGEQFSHMEVEPSWLQGVTTGSLPYPDHNQGPRSVLASAMKKQTFSGIVNPFRLNTTQHILEYPMRSIAENRIVKDLQLEDYCTGQMIEFVVVATDHTMEDSWDINQQAVDRGFQRTSLVRRYFTSIKPTSNNGNGKVNEVFEKAPKNCIGLQDANYDKLQADGLPLVGTYIEMNDIVIGKTYEETNKYTKDGDKTLPIYNATNKGHGGALGYTKKHDDSINVRDEHGIVQSVRSITGPICMKEVTIKSLCLNEIGDKSFFHHGQKGTDGIKRKNRDVYISCQTGRRFTKVFNPIGGLARMTDGLFTETEMSTVGALMGQYVNSTPFLTDTQKEKELDIIKTLVKFGCQKLNYQTCINGMTGELTQPLLTGVCYQSPLVHLVGSKIHARNFGPRKTLTRHPEDGRSRDGGLRLGNMELDSMIASGCSHLTLESLLIRSDGYQTFLCDQCGLLAEAKADASYVYCRLCNSTINISKATMHYAQKLLAQEFMALHVRPQFLFSGNNHPKEKNINIEKAQNILSGNDVDSYYKLRLIPEPEPWEFIDVGVPIPANLQHKLQEMKAQPLATTMGRPSFGSSSYASYGTAGESPNVMDNKIRMPGSPQTPVNHSNYIPYSYKPISPSFKQI